MPATISANRVADALQVIDMRLRSADMLHENVEEILAGMLRDRGDVSADSVRYTAKELECLSFMIGEMLRLARGEVEPILSEVLAKPAA